MTVTWTEACYHPTSPPKLLEEQLNMEQNLRVNKYGLWGNETESEFYCQRQAFGSPLMIKPGTIYVIPPTQCGTLTPSNGNWATYRS